MAARVFAERDDAPETALDRWTAGWWFSRPSPAALRRYQRRRFMTALLAHAEGLGDWDDSRLRQAARAAFAVTDEALRRQSWGLVIAGAVLVVVGIVARSKVRS